MWSLCTPELNGRLLLSQKDCQGCMLRRLRGVGSLQARLAGRGSLAPGISQLGQVSFAPHVWHCQIPAAPELALGLL